MGPTQWEARVDREQQYLSGEMEVVAVPRAWVRAHGFPATYDEACAVAADPTSGVTRVRRTRQALIQESWRQPETEVAYLREGDRGQACLFVQAWAGPA